MSEFLLGASRVLSTTDGADKFTKVLMGALAVQSTVNAGQQVQCAAAVQNLAGVRSVLRFGRIFGLVMKLLSLRDLVAAQGFKHTENKKFVEFLKIVLDLLYAAGDQVLLVARSGLLRTSAEVGRLVQSTRVVQVLCHLFGVVLNLYDLRDAARRLVYDPPAAKRACTIATIGTLRHCADTVVAASLLGHVRNGWVLDARSEGALVCFSGVLSTYVCWKYN